MTTLNDVNAARPIHILDCHAPGLFRASMIAVSAVVEVDPRNKSEGDNLE
jgi:hypothetical protein